MKEKKRISELIPLSGHVMLVFALHDSGKLAMPSSLNELFQSSSGLRGCSHPACMKGCLLKQVDSDLLDWDSLVVSH
jgi:hypothetical protein